MRKLTALFLAVVVMAFAGCPKPAVAPVDAVVNPQEVVDVAPAVVPVPAPEFVVGDVETTPVPAPEVAPATPDVPVTPAQ